jgi:hypothetical protein
VMVDGKVIVGQIVECLSHSGIFRMAHPFLELMLHTSLYTIIIVQSRTV